MSLSIRQVKFILEKENCRMIITESAIREETHPSDNYYQLIEVDGEWEHSLKVNERTNQPEKREIKRFETETEGAKYFLLNRLLSCYNNICVYAAAGALSEAPTITEMKEALTREGVSSDKLQYQERDVKNTYILVNKVDEEHVILSLYVDGMEMESSIPLRNRRGLGIAFMKAFLLDLFEKKVEPIFKRENIPYGQDDLVTFVFS